MEKGHTCKIVSLLTDFGLHDDYVGQMKATIFKYCPDTKIVDLCHEIAPGDIRSGSFLLSKNWEYFPDGTVHLCVVDPGVGTARGILAAKTKKHIFIAPDNGLLDPLLKKYGYEDLRKVENDLLFRKRVSYTFHGRDVFSPVAARLVSGVPLEKVGPKVDTWLKGKNIFPVQEEDELHGVIMWIDRFGNLVSNLPGDKFEGSQVTVARMHPRKVRTFKEGELGEHICIVGSKDTIEVVMRGGNAARTLGVGIGEKITLRPE